MTATAATPLQASVLPRPVTAYTNEPMSSYVFRIGRVAHLPERRLLELLGYPRPTFPSKPQVDDEFLDRLAIFGGQPRPTLESRLIHWSTADRPMKRLDTSYGAKGGTSCPHCRLLRNGAAQVGVHASLEYICPIHLTWTNTVPDRFGAGELAYPAAFAATRRLMLLAESHRIGAVAGSVDRSLQILESFMRGRAAPSERLQSIWDQRSLAQPTQPQFIFHICFPEIVDIASAIVADDRHLAYRRLTERIVDLVVYRILG